ncbi:MAG: hypothetical protein R3C56_08505 [Pirellulaceae bacterium]
MWTSSFVMVTAGWSLLLLSLFYIIMDIGGLRGWATVFTIIGVNAITIYIARASSTSGSLRISSCPASLR